MSNLYSAINKILNVFGITTFMIIIYLHYSAHVSRIRKINKYRNFMEDNGKKVHDVVSEFLSAKEIVNRNNDNDVDLKFRLR